MSIILTDRRGIFYEQNGRGELQVIHVSPTNSRTVLKDLQGNETRSEVATRAGIIDQLPLWRYTKNQVVLYGTLARGIAERTQAAKVYLAEDYVPKECNVFYFVFGRTWIIHGRREYDEEGNIHWRVTALQQKGETEITKLLSNSLNDQMLISDDTRPAIGVHNDNELLDTINKEIAVLGQKAVPFTSFKPASNIRPLFTQRNNTLVYFTGLFLVLLVMISTLVYAALAVVEKSSLETRIADLHSQIAQIEINPRIGYIREPELVLQTIKQTFNQQPSAIVDAAARFGALYGDLSMIIFAMPNTSDMGGGVAEAPTLPMESGQYLLHIETVSSDKKLLVAQEVMTKDLVEHMPWIRAVENVSAPSDEGLKLKVVMQVEKSELTGIGEQAGMEAQP